MIDTKLIEAYQWIVDESQKKPGWWAEHAIMAAVTIDIVRRVITWKGGWDAVILLLVMVMAVLLVHAARNPPFLRQLGSSTAIRSLFLVIVILRVCILFGSDQISIHLMDLVGSTAMLSYYCFAACDDPRPKKRQEKLVPNAA
jgi:hypothetical protein